MHSGSNIRISGRTLTHCRNTVSVILPDSGKPQIHNTGIQMYMEVFFTIVLSHSHVGSEKCLAASSFSSIHMQRSLSGWNVFWHSSLIIAS